jgi:hypothetical protein
MAKRNNNRGRQPDGPFRPSDLLQPIKFYRDAAGKAVVVSGFRRINALRKLAERGVAGFDPTMPIPAKEVPPPTGKGRRDIAQDGDRQ